MTKLLDSPLLSKHVTASGIKSRQVYNWYYFPHSFSPEIVDFLLSRYDKLSSGFRILDPFSGSGTAILRSIELGLDAVGIDIMPLSIHIGKAKTSEYDPDRLNSIYKIITEHDEVGQNFTTDLSFVNKIFDDDVAKYLAGLSIALEKEDHCYKSFFMTWLARLADEASGAVKSGGFTRNYSSSNKKSDRSTGVKPPLKVDSVIELGQSIFDSMLKSMKSIKRIGTAKFYLGDARKVADVLKYEAPFDIIITSPPYPNRQDYTRIFAPELFATYSFSSSEHKSLRYSSFRSHLEAKQPQENTQPFSEELERIILQTIQRLVDDHVSLENLKSERLDGYRKKKLDPRVPKMIAGYFEDIYQFLSSAINVIKPGAEVCIIVANVRHSGSVIECDTIISKIGEIVGFDHVETLVARHKGNSSQQMKYLQRIPLRESVVVMRRKHDG